MKQKNSILDSYTGREYSEHALGHRELRTCMGHPRRVDVPGDILIFLTGQEECERAVSMLREEARGAGGSFQLEAMPLYAGLPPHLQLACLEPARTGHRKVVVATNVAETSITLEGVVTVIDCCFSKQRVYDPLAGLESLVVVPVSKQSAAQRAGRAGRVRPGECFRLCTEEDFLALPAADVPEVQRSELSGAVLQLKMLGVDNLVKFPWLSAPPAEVRRQRLGWPLVRLGRHSEPHQ